MSAGWGWHVVAAAVIMREYRGKVSEDNFSKKNHRVAIVLLNPNHI